MALVIPKEYVTEQFLQHAGYVKKLSNGTLNGGCPHCHEGKSWGKKRRLYYVPEKQLIFCHNCNMSWSPLKWIQEVTNDSFKNLIQEANKYDTLIPEYEESEKVKRKHILPHEAINLFNREQIDFYRNNNIVKRAVKYVIDRRLHLAVNHVDLYISISDFTHKNRVIIPFYNRLNKIDFYQTRSLFDDDYPKYLSKMDADKTIFGIRNVNPSLPYIFLTEGPIDAMFIRNGLGLAGLNITEIQKDLLSQYFLFEKIWVLDNQLDNKDVKNKYIELIERGERVFFWPDDYKGIKDVNELCCKRGVNEVEKEFFIENSFTDYEARKRIPIL